MKKFNLLMTCIFVSQIPQIVQAEEQKWIDKQHDRIHETLNSWAKSIDNWIVSPILRILLVLNYE